MMKNFELMSDLQDRIAEIKQEFLPPLLEAEQCYLAAEKSLKNLKVLFQKSELSPEQEQEFFKKIKPWFLSQMIYYAEVYKMEANQPFGPKKQFRKFYIREQKKVSQFISEHQAFYSYHKSGRTGMDHEYFMRDPDKITSPDSAFIEVDETFSTYHSTLLSLLIGNERLNEFIEDKLEARSNFLEAPSFKSMLRWTGQKVKLIELGYALHAMGVCNEGKADIKQIMDGLEMLFNIKLGNYYSVFLKKIRLRKKNMTIFLDELKASLLHRMDEQDANPRYS
ncbi:RteC protein [Ostertagia ostertagi]